MTQIQFSHLKCSMREHMINSGLCSLFYSYYINNKKQILAEGALKDCQWQGYPIWTLDANIIAEAVWLYAYVSVSVPSLAGQTTPCCWWPRHQSASTGPGHSWSILWLSLPTDYMIVVQLNLYFKCCTLRSGLHEIPLMIKTFPHGFEDNHACKWISDNFPGMLTCMVVLQSMWKGPNHCWNFMKSGSESATNVNIPIDDTNFHSALAPRPGRVMVLICLHVCLFVCLCVCPLPMYFLMIDVLLGQHTSDPQYFYRFRTPYKMTIRGAD